MWQCLLISVTLSTAAPETPPSAEEPERPLVVYAPLLPGFPPNPKVEPVAAASPTTDRWLLQKELQGTGPGDLLDTNRVQLYGWIDTSFTGSSDKISNLPMGFNYRATDLLVQQAWVRLTRPVVTTDTEPTWGFLVDTFFGSDYRFTLSRGLFDGQLTARHGLPAFYGVDAIQFYLEGYVPTFAGGLDVKLGRFYTPFGLENADAPSNPLVSHSYINAESPLDNSGLLFSLNLTPVWQVQAGLVLGSDIFIDQADEPTFVGSVQWTQPPAGRSVAPNTVKFAVTLGSGWFNVRDAFNHFNTFDLSWIHPLNRRMLYQAELLYEYQDNVPDTKHTGRFDHRGVNNFGGAAQYLICTFTPRLSGAVRLELFDAPQGFTGRTSPDGAALQPGLYTEVAAGLTFRLWQQPSGAGDFVIRPELRFDDNAQSRAFEGHYQLYTAAVDFIVRW